MNARLLQLLCIAPVLLLNLLFSSAAHAADATANDVSSLIVTYHAVPGNRPALREELEKSGIRQFQRWKDEGILKNFRILFSRYADSDNWDAMAILTFSSPANMGRWEKIEKTTPAGLSQKALALVTVIHTTPTSLARSMSAAETPTNPVFLVIPYVSLVSTGDYLKYADGYAIPQFDGWVAEGVLSHYDLFTSTFPAGRTWHAMLILEYKDEEALAQRNAVEAKVRGKLKDVPEWKTISDNKKNIRDEKQVVIAEKIVAH